MARDRSALSEQSVPKKQGVKRKCLTNPKMNRYNSLCLFEVIRNAA